MASISLGLGEPCVITGMPLLNLNRSITCPNVPVMWSSTARAGLSLNHVQGRPRDCAALDRLSQLRHVKVTPLFTSSGGKARHRTEPTCDCQEA